MISANQVEFSFKQYLKEALLQVWRHQTIYLIPVFLMTVFVAFYHTVIPFNSVSNIIGVFVFGWSLFFVMELTFSSTQEKYTPKKYLTSLLISLVSFIQYLKHYSHYVIVAVGIGFLFWIYDDLTSIAITNLEPTKKDTLLYITQEFIRNFLFDNVPRGMASFLIIGMISKNSVTDFFVTTRIMGIKGGIPDYQINQSMSVNYSSWRKIAYIIFGLFIIKPVFLIFAPLAILILSISITFYSMDIFGVDKMKKIKEMETKKAENFNAVPEMT